MPTDPAMFALLHNRGARRGLGRATLQALRSAYPGQVGADEVEPLLSDPRLHGVLLRPGHTLTYQCWTAPVADVHDVLGRPLDPHNLLYFRWDGPDYDPQRRAIQSDIEFRVYHVTAIDALPAADGTVRVHLTPGDYVSLPYELAQHLFR